MLLQQEQPKASAGNKKRKVKINNWVLEGLEIKGPLDTWYWHKLQNYIISGNNQNSKRRGFSPNKIAVWAGGVCKGQYSPPHRAGDILKGTEIQGCMLNLSPKKVSGKAPTDFQEDRFLPLKFRNIVKRDFFRLGWFHQEMPNNEHGGEQAMMMWQHCSPESNAGAAAELASASSVGTKMLFHPLFLSFGSSSHRK